MGDTAAVTAEDADVAAALEDVPEAEKMDHPTRKSVASLIHSMMHRQSQFPELETEAVSETENIGGDSTPNLEDENPPTTNTKALDNAKIEALEKAKELSGKRSGIRSRSTENKKSANRKRSVSVRISKSRSHSSGSSLSSFSDEMEFRERRSIDTDRGHFKGRNKRGGRGGYYDRDREHGDQGFRGRGRGFQGRGGYDYDGDGQDRGRGARGRVRGRYIARGRNIFPEDGRGRGKGQRVNQLFLRFQQQHRDLFKDSNDNTLYGYGERREKSRPLSTSSSSSSTGSSRSRSKSRSKKKKKTRSSDSGSSSSSRERKKKKKSKKKKKKKVKREIEEGLHWRSAIRSRGSVTAGLEDGAVVPPPAKYHHKYEEESRTDKHHRSVSRTRPRSRSRTSHRSRSPSRSRTRSPQDLPSKIYEANCSVVLTHDILESGVAAIHISHGNSAYCFFDRESLVTPINIKYKLSQRVRKGDKMKIRAWLLNEKAKIPYLAAVIWMPGVIVPSDRMDVLCDLPDVRHMEKFHHLSKDMARQLRKSLKDEESESNLSRIEFRERSKSGKYEELERPGLGLELEPVPQQELRPIPTAPLKGKKIAIGRNVFIHSDEEESKDHLVRGRGRGIGRAMAMGRNVYHSTRDSKRVVEIGRMYRDKILAEKKKASKIREEALEDISSENDKIEEINIGEEAIENISSESDVESVKRSDKSPPATTSRISYPEKYYIGSVKVSEELLVTVIEYPHEQVGLLQGSQHSNVLFHINQVWVNHSSEGFCPFREIYPTADLSKHFYLGKVVKCFARSVADCSKVGLQATAVWIEGDAPNENMYRTPDLLQELNFHLGAYLNGTFWQLSTPPGLQVSHPAVIQEYISHEMGLAKLQGENSGSVLFHLDHIWHMMSGQWVLYKDVQQYPLATYHLPIGAKVMVALRRLSSSQNSGLKYQATALWHHDDHRISEGTLPAPYLVKYNQLENQADLVKSLDCYHDNLKRLCQFQLDTINPVPAVLNLLPSNWTASVCKVVDAEYGIIKITHKKDEDMTLGLNVKQMFAIFHVEDVYNISGDPFRSVSSLSGGPPPIRDLLNYPVDLTARSIVEEFSGPGILRIVAKQIILPAHLSHVACPVLQAISVFMKPQHSQNANTSMAPTPTYLRKCPESFHSNVPGTAFYLGILLQMKLDVKALNFFSTVTTNNLQKEINNGLPMAFFNKTKKNITVDKQNQMKLLKEMSILDPNHKERLIYGSFKPSYYPPVPLPFLPQTIRATPCHIQLLCREGLAAKSGVIRFNLPNEMTTYSFFDISSYKFSFQREARVADMADLIQACSNEKLMFTGRLLNPGSQIPYACTTLWKVSKWNKQPECVLRQMDGRFIQKYQRITSQIVAEWTNAESSKQTCPKIKPASQVAQHPVTSCPAMSSASTQPKIGVSLPTSIPMVIPELTVRAPPRQVWATADKITNRIGRVTSIIDGNYGLAVIKYRPVEELNELHTAIVLFDTCDLWLRADLGQPEVASNLGVSISDVMTERDHVKLNAIMVPQSDNRKNIRYIATSLITDPNKREIRRRSIPEVAPIDSLEQIHPEKINNFYAVVSVICQKLPGEPEDEIRDVSSDEVDLEDISRAEKILKAASQANVLGSTESVSYTALNIDEHFRENYGNCGNSVSYGHMENKMPSIENRNTLRIRSSNPRKEILDENLNSTEVHLKTLVSLDAFEAEREKKKLAKKNECLQNRRKMTYSKEAREMLLTEMKLQNQLLWNCDRCQVTMGKTAMEAHLTNKMHWENIENSYRKALDAIKPPTARDRKEAVYLMEMGNTIN